MTTPCYSPSGQVPASGKRAVIVAALAVVPGAWCYAWTTAPAPSVLNIVCIAGLGLWLVLVARTAARLGKVRNPRWMGRAGAVLGAWAWYVHWAAWLAMSGRLAPELQVPASLAGATYLCVRPDLVFGVAAEIVAGASSAVAGAAFVVVWSVEFFVFLATPRLAGIYRASEPFCEPTASWAEEIHVPVEFEFISDPDAVRCRLRHNPGDLLSILVPCSEDMPRFSGVTIHHCRGGTSFFTVCNMEVMRAEQIPLREVRKLQEALPDKVVSYGQVDEPVVELLPIDVEDVEALLQDWELAASNRPAMHS